MFRTKTEGPNGKEVRKKMSMPLVPIVFKYVAMEDATVNLVRLGNGSTSTSMAEREKRTKEIMHMFFARAKEQLRLSHRQSIDMCTPEELGKEELYQLFAGFLITLKYTKKVGDELQVNEYACATIIDWFNSMVQLGREKLAPKEEIFQNYLLQGSPSQLFFNKVRRDLIKKVTQRVIDQGKSLQEKARDQAGS